MIRYRSSAFAYSVTTIVTFCVARVAAQSAQPSNETVPQTAPPVSTASPAPGSVPALPVPRPVAPQSAPAYYPPARYSPGTSPRPAPVAAGAYESGAPGPTSWPSPLVHDERPPPTNWSIGAGISLFGAAFSSPSTGLMSTNTVAWGSPRTSVFLERRLWGYSYLLLQPSFDYAKFHPDAKLADSNSVQLNRSTSFDIAAGVRWVGNPGATVEIGMIHMLDVGWDYEKGSGTRYQNASSNLPIGVDATGYTYNVGITTGIVAERELMKQLWLRVQVPLLRLGFAKSRVQYDYNDGYSERYTNSAFVFTVVALPQLELRLTW